MTLSYSAEEERTAAAAGAVGVVRRDPMAMLPFCGYNMGDYFAHWLDMKNKTDKLPKIFNVNWFRTDENGHFIWPGFGDNMRVLDWIIKRCEGAVDADETAIGFVPKAEDINIDGLDINIETLKGLLDVDKDIEKTDQCICQKNSHDEIPSGSERKICGQTQIAYLNAKW